MGFDYPAVDVLYESGSVSAPGSNGTIANAGAPIVGGVYRIIVTTFQTGTVDANGRNAQLFIGGSGIVVGNLLTVSQPVTVGFERVTIPTGSTSLNIRVGSSAGGAGSVYNGCVMAERIA